MTATTANAPKLITPGVIASDVQRPLHCVLHILATRSHIKPAARAGILRLYDSAAVAMVRHELSAIEARRQERKSKQAAGQQEVSCGAA